MCGRLSSLVVEEFDDIAKAYADAVFAKDEDAFLKLYAHDFVAFDIWETWVFQGREAWAGMVRAWFSSLGDERVKVTFSPIASETTDELAMFSATARYAHVDPLGQELKSLENRLSWFLRKADGEWRIAHEHTSTPIHPETLTLVKRRD